MTSPPNSDDGNPNFDPDVANALVGKLVLIGITYEDRRGNLKRRDQFFGTVSEVDPHRGISVSLAGSRSGETALLPPDTAIFERGEKGRYRLSSTGEFVTNPDFTAAWKITVPDA